MDLIQQLTEEQNPEQNPAITADQPVNALGTQIQWIHPEKFKDIIWFMGPLHLEMVLGSLIGQCLDGSGLVDIYTKPGISTAGKIEAFLS